MGGLDPSRWIDRHGEAMFVYARLRLPGAELAEEAVQEALASAWRSRGSFEGRSSERTWLIGILRYKVLDLLAERRRAGAPIDESDGGVFTNGGFRDAQRAWGQDPDDAEVRAAIASALEGLPEIMRQAVVLREVDGIPGKTVCEILGISETNLWTLVHRGKARLRLALGERFGDDWGGVPRPD